MSATITIGHLLLLIAAIDLIAGLSFLASSRRHAGYGRGTPQYARARTSRRAALYAFVSAIAFAAIGWLTPLRDLGLMGGS